MEVIQVDKGRGQGWCGREMRITGRKVYGLCNTRRIGDADIFFRDVVIEDCESGVQSIVTVNIVNADGETYIGNYLWFVDGVIDESNTSNQYNITAAFPTHGVLSCKIETNDKMIHIVDIVNGHELEVKVQLIICDGQLDCDVPIFVNHMPGSFKVWLDKKRS